MTFYRFQKYIPLTIQIAIVTLAIRSLGLIRDSLIASELGVSIEVDNFFLTLNWIGFVISIIAASSINMFIPKIKEKIGQGGSFEEAFFHFNKRLVFLSLLVSIILFLTLRFLLFFSLPLALEAAVILFFWIHSYWLSSVLNTVADFIVPALLFVLPIVTVMGGLLSGEVLAQGLVLFFMIGVIIQWSILSYRVVSNSSLVVTDLFNLEMMGGVELKKWFGIALATIYFPVVELQNVFFAQTLPEGSIAMVNYAMRIPFAMSSILIFSIWSVALPHLDFSNEDLTRKSSKWLFDRITFLVVGMGAVVSVLYFISPELVDFIYGRSGTLTNFQKKEISGLQKIYFIALPAQLAIGLFFRYLHAKGKAFDTLMIAAIALPVSFAVFKMYGTLISVGYSYLVNFLVCIIVLVLLKVRDIAYD